MIFAFSFVQGLRMGGTIGYVGALLAFGQVVLVLAAYRRGGPQRVPCSTCPERFEMSRCRGFREIRLRERAFQRLASRMIRRAGN